MKKLKLSLACIILCTATAFANIEINGINFPDENFRNWILAQEWGKSGAISDEEIAGIIKIDVNQQNISDLTGIDFFANLEVLFVAFNQLTSLDVSRLKNLRWLVCFNNQLTSLDVSGLINLTHLIVQRNQLTSLDVSGLTSLQDFDSSHNQLTSIDLIGLNNLDFFNGQNQNPILNLRRNIFNNHRIEINLSNPQNLTEGLTYRNGILRSRSREITSSPFSVETGREGFTLSGRLILRYE